MRNYPSHVFFCKSSMIPPITSYLPATSNKRSEARSQQQNGGYLRQNGTQNFIYMVIGAQTKKE